MKRLRRISCALLLFAFWTPTIMAQTVFTDLSSAPTGQIYFESYVPSGYWALAYNKFDRKKFSTISGVLSVPDSKVKVPAMILQHGSGGVEQKDFDTWAKLLNEIGVATFVIDGFTGRGVKRTVENQSLLHNAVSIADAFVALRLLATHPRVDASRIGVMGFSRGGLVANQTIWEPYRKALINDDLRFTVHIALYPGCHQNIWSEGYSNASVFMLLGARDDYAPAEFCRAYAGRMKNLGVNVTVIEYADAYHSFDAPYAWRYDATAETTRKCGVLENQIEKWQWRIAQTHQPVPDKQLPAFFKACVTTGASYGANRASNALEKAVDDVKAIIKRAFAL
jgi:dienelactone hydrolase